MSLQSIPPMFPGESSAAAAMFPGEGAAFPGDQPGDIPATAIVVSKDTSPAAPDSGATAQAKGSTPTAPAIPDMQIARSLLDPFRLKAKEFADKAKKITVTDSDSAALATNLAGEVKRALSSVEDARKAYTKPLNDHIKQVNGLANEIKEPLEAADKAVRQRLSVYMAQEEIKRRKAAEDAAREAAETQARLDAEAEAAGVTAPIVPEILPPAGKTTGTAIRAEGGTAFTKSKWEFELLNIADVPPGYLALDESKVRQAIKAGVHKIPGLRIFEDKRLNIR